MRDGDERMQVGLGTSSSGAARPVSSTDTDHGVFIEDTDSDEAPPSYEAVSLCAPVTGELLSASIWLLMQRRGSPSGNDRERFKHLSLADEMLLLQGDEDEVSQRGGGKNPNVQMLTAMGFPRDHAVRALLQVMALKWLSLRSEDEASEIVTPNDDPFLA